MPYCAKGQHDLCFQDNAVREFMVSQPLLGPVLGWPPRSFGQSLPLHFAFSQGLFPAPHHELVIKSSGRFAKPIFSWFKTPTN